MIILVIARTAYDCPSDSSGCDIRISSVMRLNIGLMVVVRVYRIVGWYSYGSVYDKEALIYSDMYDGVINSSVAMC